MNERRENILNTFITTLTHRIHNNPNEQEAFFKRLDSDKYEHWGDIYRALTVLGSHVINHAQIIERERE